MCDLCSSNPKLKQAAREGTRMRAEQLELMADILRGLASGRLQPHNSLECGGIYARSIIRYLVEEWM
jgi:hypothetical protein